MASYLTGYGASPLGPSRPHSRDPSWMSQVGPSSSQSSVLSLPSIAVGFGERGEPGSASARQEQLAGSGGTSSAPVNPYAYQYVDYQYQLPQPSISPSYSMTTSSSTHRHHDLVSPPLPTVQLPWQPVTPSTLSSGPGPQPSLGPSATQQQYAPDYYFYQDRLYSPELPTSPVSYGSNTAVSPSPSIDPHAVYATPPYPLNSDVPPLPYYPHSHHQHHPHTNPHPPPYNGQPSSGPAWAPVSVTEYCSELPSSAAARAREQAAAERVQHKRFPCPYPGCTLRFARLNDQQRHSRIHTGESPFACRRCGHRFKRSDARRRHELKQIC